MALAARQPSPSDDPSYLLFTDADVLFHPDAIRRSSSRPSSPAPTTSSPSPPPSSDLPAKPCSSASCRSWASGPPASGVYKTLEPSATLLVSEPSTSSAPRPTSKSAASTPPHADHRRRYPGPPHQTRRPPPARSLRPRHGQPPLGRRSLRRHQRHDQKSLRRLRLPSPLPSRILRRTHPPLADTPSRIRPPLTRLPAVLTLASIAALYVASTASAASPSGRLSPFPSPSQASSTHSSAPWSSLSIKEESPGEAPSTPSPNSARTPKNSHKYPPRLSSNVPGPDVSPLTHPPVKH